MAWPSSEFSLHRLATARLAQPFEMPDLRVTPDAAGQRRIAGRLLAAVLSLAEHLHPERRDGAAAVVSERLQERLLGDAELAARESGLAPLFHVIGAAAPRVVLVVVFRLLHATGEHLQPFVHGAGLTQVQALHLPEAILVLLVRPPLRRCRLQN